jgi:hypothetical protein
MKNLFALLLMCLSFLFFSCEKDSGPVFNIPDKVSTVNDSVPSFTSFSKDIQPIFNMNCVVCHNENHPFLNLKACCSWEEILISGSSAPYVDTISPSESYLYIKLAGAGQNPAEMPPGGPYLSKPETDKILKWIEEGAKNN